MDKIDSHLLSALRRDARAPIVTLSKAIGLSRSATQARLKRLKEDGSIRGFTIIESKQAEQTAHFMVSLKPGHKCIQVVPSIKKIAGVISIHTVTGDVDLLIRAETANIEDVEAIRFALAETSGVAAVKTLIVLTRHLN